MSRKNNADTLIKKYSIAKKCKPSSKLSPSHNLFAGEGSWLTVDGCWLTGVVAEEGRWGGCGNFLKDKKVGHADGLFLS